MRYTAGELGTQRIEFRQASALGRDWYLKAVGGYHRSGDFTRSRVETAEYAPATLPRDLVAPTLGKVRLSFGSLRIDKYTTPERLLTFELGTAHEEGPVTLSPLARIQATDVDQPWFRFNLAAPRWNVLAYYTGNRLDGTRNLTANSLLYIRASHIAVEAQGNRQFAGARGRVIAGVEFGGQTVDSADPNGAQTAYDRKRSTKYGSVFGQIEYRLTRETECRRFRALGSQHAARRKGIATRGSGLRAGAVPDAACDLRQGVSGGEPDGVFSEHSCRSADRSVSR